MKLDEEPTLQPKKQAYTKYQAPRDDQGFHQFVPPKEDATLFEQKYIKSTIKGMNELLGGRGYPPGSVISLVSVPKAGKTTLAIHESINMAMRGDDVLYMYNESIQKEFMRIVDRHRQDLNIDRKEITTPHLTFLDRHRLQPGSAGYAVIEGFVDRSILTPIQSWVEKHDNPKLVVIDSLTKFIRAYPAQAFVFAQKMMYGIKEIFYSAEKYPVVLCINQKASTYDKRDDESVLGGLGIVHDMDGSFVIRTETVNKWVANDLGLELGSKLRVFRIEDIRLSNADSREHILVREYNEQTKRTDLIMGEALSELLQMAKERNSNNET